jgi:LruC domain-containing protein
MKKLNRVLFLLMLQIIVLDAAASKWYVNDASAANDIFCSATGTTSGTGTASDPCLTLKIALDKSREGDSIFIDAGTYNGVGNRDLKITTLNLYVTGAGMEKTIFDNEDAGTTGRYFVKIESPVTMSNLKITRYGIQNSSNPAHAIEVYENIGPVAINNVHIDNNGRTTGNYVVEIRNGANVVFNGGGLSCNKNWESAGGIRIGLGAEVQMNNYLFIDNYRNADGAVVRINGGNVEINHSRFEDNHDGGDLAGTAIYMGSGALLVDNTHFESNLYNIYSNNIGGLIRIAGGTATISNSVIKSTANEVSGNNAYGALGVSGTSVVNVENCLFTGNLTGRGSDIYNSGGAITITNSTFNSANYQIASRTGTISISQSGNPTINPSYKTGVSLVNTTAPSNVPNPEIPDYTGSCPAIVILVSGPDATDDVQTTDMNTTVEIDVLANDIAGDAILNPVSVTFVPATIPDPLTVGVFSVNSVTGMVTFVPALGFTGTTDIDYQVCDISGLCDIAKITVNVTVVTGPTANDDTSVTLVNTEVEIDVLSNDIAGSKAINPESVTFITETIPNPATEGNFTFNPSTGLVTFTPSAGFTGTVTVDYQVCDSSSMCDTASISVNVIVGLNNLYPATGPGTLAFEDLWPARGDYDFNDLVIDYQFEIITNTGNFVQQVVGTFVIKAFGASYENGFGFQLSDKINPEDVTVTGYDLTENFISLDVNGTEADQSKATIIVYDNSFAQMPHPGSGIGVNTELDAPYVTPVTLTIQMAFKPNTYSYNDLDISNFNPFLIVNKNRGVEVHLPDFPPTDLADAALFGTEADNSNAAAGKYYLTENNLPWAINLYERFDYPIEKQDILWVHLKFADWAESNGVSFPDWYKNLNGYRNDELVYPEQ